MKIIMITTTMIMAATMTMIVMKTKRACKPGFPKKVDEMGGVIRMGAFAKHLLNSQNLLPFYPDLPNLQLRPSLGLLYLLQRLILVFTMTPLCQRGLFQSVAWIVYMSSEMSLLTLVSSSNWRLNIKEAAQFSQLH